MSQSCCIPCQSKAVCTKYGCFEKQFFLEILSKTVQILFLKGQTIKYQISPSLRQKTEHTTELKWHDIK